LAPQLPFGPLRGVTVGFGKVGFAKTKPTRGTTMTKPSMALTDLAEKAPDADLLRQMIQFVAQRLMDMDVETLCGAGYDVKSAERVNSRSGPTFCVAFAGAGCEA
jgi:hypothetical protein